MAASEALSQTGWEPIISRSTSTTSSIGNVTFDPSTHLAYEPPKQIHMMTDLGYEETTGVSPVAASEPFQLFSKDAIEQFRAEIFQPEVMSECSYSGSLGACMLRGYSRKYAQFVHDAWNNPETLKIVSDIAGVDLVPNMDFEIGHINISVKSEQQAADERKSVSQQAAQGKPWEDESPVVGWHHDSYPFVCVTMLSDCTNMVGGETVLRMANGEVMRVRGPQMGCAVILQGRYITHQALRALGAQERITMVTSFRPKNHLLKDDSVLDTVRGISDLSELYYGYAKYRLEALETRVQYQLSKLMENYHNGKRTNTKALKQFLDESIKFMETTNAELVPDEEVVAGQQPTLDIANVSVSAADGLKGIKSKL